MNNEVYEFLEKELCFFISKRGLLLKTGCFIRDNKFFVSLHFENVKKNKNKRLFICCTLRKGRIFNKICIKENLKEEELEIIRLAVNSCAKKIIFVEE